MLISLVAPRALSTVTCSTDVSLSLIQTRSGLTAPPSASVSVLTSSLPSAADDVGNYCVVNPLSKQGSVTLSNGNLGFIGASNQLVSNGFGTIAMTEGKWYMEMASATTANNWGMGVVNNEFIFADERYDDANGWFVRYESTTVLRDYVEGTFVNHTSGITAVTDDRLCLAIDVDNLKVWGGIVDATDNTTKWMDAGTGMTGNPGAGSDQFASIDGPPFYFSVGTSDVQAQVNFGQQAFLGTIPTGFKRLHTANLVIIACFSAAFIRP